MASAIVETETEKKTEERYDGKASDRVEYSLRAYRSAFYMMTDLLESDPRFDDLVWKYCAEWQAYRGHQLFRTMGESIKKFMNKGSGDRS